MDRFLRAGPECGPIFARGACRACIFHARKQHIPSYTKHNQTLQGYVVCVSFHDNTTHLQEKTAMCGAVLDYDAPHYVADAEDSGPAETPGTDPSVPLHGGMWSRAWSGASMSQETSPTTGGIKKHFLTFGRLADEGGHPSRRHRDDVLTARIGQHPGTKTPKATAAYLYQYLTFATTRHRRLDALGRLRYERATTPTCSANCPM